MNAPPRRIIVGLDGGGDALRAFDEAAEMAARVGAELVGIFVEDNNLLELAALPCASEVGDFTGHSRGINAVAIQQALRLIAEQARRALARAAAHHGVRWSFTIARGSVPAQLLAAAATEAAAARASLLRPRVRVRIESAGRAVWMAHWAAARAQAGCAVILMDAGFLAMRNLSTALALVDEARLERQLVVVVAHSPIDARRQRDRIAAALADDSVPVEVRMSGPLEVAALHAFLVGLDCGALLVTAAGLCGADEIVGIVETAGFPVFVIR